MHHDKFPRSLRESDGHNHGNPHIEDNEPPHSLARTLIGPLIMLVILALLLLCYAVAPDTTANDCHTDTECESLTVKERK